MELQGKRALITGSSGGIGQAIAVAYGQAGADVAVHYHKDVGAANTVVQDLQKLGRKAVALEANAAEVVEVQRLVAQTVEALGGVDVVVNSAGLEIREPFLDVSEQ